MTTSMFLPINLQSGKFEAHGMNPKWTGTDASDLHDVEGKPLVKEMLELAKSKGEGTVDYVWRNPVTNSRRERNAPSSAAKTAA
jgi:cytochrome c